MHGLQDEVDSLDRRVKNLEELIKRDNADLESMEMVLAAILDGDYITGVIDNDDGKDGMDDLYIDVKIVEGGNIITFYLCDRRNFFVPIM